MSGLIDGAIIVHSAPSMEWDHYDTVSSRRARRVPGVFATDPTAGRHNPMAMHDDAPFMRRAACSMLRSVLHPDTWAEGGAAARAVCKRCPVVDQCLRYALDHPELKGTWAGYSEPELRRMRKEAA